MTSDNIFDLIYQKTGLMTNENKQAAVLRVLDVLAETQGISSHAAVITKLMEVPPSDLMWRSLVEVITIGETYFFRNKFHFKALQEHILPSIIQAKRNMNIRTLRIWSAGCSTGEEPYSIAMLLHDVIPDIDQWSIQIIGTDINESYMEHARKGVYGKNSFRNETRSDIRGRWFTENGHTWELSPKIKRMVHFTHLNLISDDYPAPTSPIVNLDLIFCRNVTIYFEQETTQKIIHRLHDSLIPTGWLVVGHAEPMASSFTRFDTHNFENAIIYQRPAAVLMMPEPKPTPSPTKIVVSPTKPKQQPSQLKLHPITPKPAPPKIMPETTASAPEKPLWQQAKEAVDRSDWEQAIRILENAERETPMVPQVHYLHGLIFLQDQADDDAFQAFRRAIYCDPNFSLAYYHLGELYTKRGNKIEAQRHWEKALATATTYDNDAYLPFDQDLTVADFCELITYRMNTTRKNGDA